jgi:signal transduction histidine kinase/CheY-like chemotaxis protein
MSNLASLVPTALLAVLLAILLIDLIWSIPTAGSGLRVLYGLVCAGALVLTVIQWRSTASLSNAVREAEVKQVEVVGYQAQLEKRVSELIRTNAALQQNTLQFHTAAQVCHAVTSLRNPDELMQAAVNLMRDRFDLHYVGLFLVDDSGRWAVLRAGTGQIGRQMLAQGYRLEIGGDSAVGWCTAHARPRNVVNAGEPATRPNIPPLPDMRSEVSLPLQFGGRVIGALDLHSTRSQAFSDEDIAVLQALADQVAVAIDNAQAFLELRSHLEETTARQRSAVRQQQRPNFALDPITTRYERTQPELPPLDDDWLSQVEPALVCHETVVQADPGNGKGYAALVAPVKLRNQVIGSLGFHEKNGRHWSADEIALIEDVADQMALAVENARLIEQTQAALTETEALYRASRRITSSTDMPTLYQILVDEMADRLEADQCQLIIFDHDEGCGKTVAEYRTTSDERKIRVPIAGNPSYAILHETQQPLVIEDVSVHPAVAHLRSALAQDKIRSMLLVPVVVRDEIIGALEIAWVGQKQAFAEAELDFCQTLASQAAITIENMRAFEEEKETTERLREVDKFKTQFLANMSHELRTPLNSIIGFSRVILKGIDGPLTELQQNDLTAIYHSGQHLLGLINDILDLSKIEAGKMELNVDEVDLKPIIKGVMSTAVGLVKGKPIELVHHMPADLPTIWADSTRVRQILLNLISNATKFTQSGRITVSADCDDEWVAIRVTDTGIGIPEEKLEKIFEEFTQVDGSTTRSVGGTGLGLPISRHFIEMHGGKISVESQVGVGSTFTVTLPIHAQTAPQQQPVEDQLAGVASAPERRIVLAVDDDPGVISLYRRYLEREAYQVLGVTCSEDVLAKAIELQPFAITLDVLMPNKDGWQVLRELKECPQTQHIPIIICSIVSNEGLGFSLGAADYLVKPIMEEELLDALSSLNQGDPDPEQEVEVLVIDDQADDILLIRRILEAQHRYQVTGADGGQAGIDLVRQHQPDVIILDLMMPEVDGFAVLEVLKGQPETRNIPIIVITAKQLTEEEHRRLNGQVEVLLRKGLFTEHELLDDLSKALNRIKLRQPQ